MEQFAAFFRLIRYKNLLVVFATQFFVWLFIIMPFGKWAGEALFLSLPRFLLLSFSTVCIAAAGYIINDYFDVKIDLINRPDTVIIERIINRRMAIIFHTLLNVIGLLAAFYLAWQLHNRRVFLLQAFTTVLLWFYSTGFKRQFMIGNVVVALLTGFTVWMLCLYEPALYPYANFKMFAVNEHGREIVNPYLVIGVYAYFAFLLTWMREVIKDMEDFKGDAEDGCVTMPIKIGLRYSSWFVLCLGVLALVPLCIAAFKFLGGHWNLLGGYIVLFLIAPLIWLMFRLPAKATSSHYARLSRWLKIIMLLGIFSLLLYYGLQYDIFS